MRGSAARLCAPALDAAQCKALAAADYQKWIRPEPVWRAADFYERKYSPDQPRDDLGRWTSGGGGGGGINDSRVISDVTPDNDWKPGEQYAQSSSGSPPDDPNKTPTKRPATIQERNSIARRSTRSGLYGLLLEKGATWLKEYYAEYQSYKDPPKTLEELQNAVSDKSAPGYHDHHVVERSTVDEGLWGKDEINAQENLVRIPKYKHEDITKWYATKNDEEPFNGLSPREYLTGRDWSERYKMGLKALIDNGVLKP